jgi:hypothetical protein
VLIQTQLSIRIYQSWFEPCYLYTNFNNWLMIQRKKPDVDIINDVLVAAMEAYPKSDFVKSLHQQYHERGGLSKKQLQGLFYKAEKIPGLPVSKLATLEAEILKKPTRYKSPLPANTPLYTKDEESGKMIDDILSKYPQHKRVLFFKAKYDNNETLSASEVTELKKFHSVLMK